MRFLDKHTGKECCPVIRYALIILPAVALGILVMLRGGVSPALWGQQAAAWVMFALLARPLRHAVGRVCATVWSALFVILLAVTLFGADVGGTRRWLDLVVFQANAAMLFLPPLLIVLYRAKYPHLFLLTAAAVLSLQPDLSQLTAFCAAALPLLWQNRAKRIWNWGGLLVLGALIIRCTLVPLTLQPEPYCEGILTILGEMSWILQAAGWIALAVIPAFFVLRFRREGGLHLLSIAIYYAVIMAFCLTGEYPVPFMGFGLSPIAGYWFAYACCSHGEQHR